MLVRFTPLMIVLVLLSSVMARESFAQQKAANPRQIRANNIVNAMLERENAENADFNAHLTELNAHGWPLELKNLDTAQVSSSVLRTLGFLEYLKKCHASSDSLDRAFTDSLFILEAEAPGGKLEKSLRLVKETFTEERAAYNNFLGSLEDLFNSVLNALLYLQSEPYKVTGDKFAFVHPKASKHYMQLMKKVDEAMKEETKTNDALKKATAEANARVKQQNTASDDDFIEE